MDRPIIDILWVLVCAGLVFMMQAGFLCLETGLTRSKNNINVAIKNLADFALTTILFWAFGYALMFGLTKNGWFGSTGFLLNLSQEGAWVAVFFLFEVMFCGTAVTILSGATAERMRFSGYLITAALVSGLIYPLFGHWAWNSADIGSLTGWLGKRGFVDFAGSTVVHSVGGWAALAILIIIGPRTGRFPKDGPPKYIPGANIPMASLGVLLLWLGWFGFNGGSTLAMNDQVSKIVANTVLGGSSGLAVTIALGWAIRKRVDVPFAINGSLAGLVAVTANVHAVSSLSAVVIGGIGGIVMLGVSNLLEHFRIDDAVDAVPVHLGAGIWGTIAVALFGNSELLGTDLTFGAQLGVQVLGIFVCFVWTFGATYLILRIINRFSPLRVTQEDEHIGLNVSEHGASTELVELFTVMDHQLRTQDLSLRAPVEPFTEVGQIAKQYNRVMEALEKATARIKAIVTTAMDGIITFSKEGLLITTLNPAAETIFGYRETQIRNQPITLLMGSTEDGSPESESRWIDSILSETVAAGAYHEMIGRRADGSTFQMEGVVTQAKASKETFYTATFRDITERKKMMTKLARANEEIKTFAHIVSHDLRSPLVNIKGFSHELKSVCEDIKEILKEVSPHLTDEQQKQIEKLFQEDMPEALGFIDSSASTMDRLVSSILDLSRIGRRTLHFEEIETNKLVEEKLKTLHHQIESKGIKIKLKELPNMTADESALDQVFGNILSNAINYLDPDRPGIIEISGERRRKEILFSVKDNGRGIAEEDFHKVFELFRRAGKPCGPGEGMGLAYVKALVERHSGEIWFESQEGKGTTFYFAISDRDGGQRTDDSFQKQVQHKAENDVT